MHWLREHWIDAAWFILVAAVSSIWVATASQVVGPTFDEPFYMENGLHAWRTGSVKPLMTKGVMTLPLDVQTLPVYLWERDRGEQFEAYSQLHTILPVARLANLPFWWLLLLYGMRWGHLLGGPWAGRLACLLFAVDPNLLGHAALATTDIALCGTVLLATYHFNTNRESTWPRRVLIPGLLYGMALTAKASAMPYVPLLAAVFGMHHLWRTDRLSGLFTGTVWQRIGAFRRATSRLRWDLVYVMLLGFVYVFAYTGCDWTTEVTFVQWAAQLPDGSLKSVMLPFAENLRIFPNAGEGLIQQIKHNFRGHTGSFLLGTYHRGSVWYYFPVALTVKLADPTLLLFVVVMLTRPRMFFRSPAGWAVVVLLLFSFNTKVQIGVRLVFPMMCFLLIGMAVAVCASARGRSILAILAGFVIVGTAWESMESWPDGVRFTNQLHGGPSAGWQHLADSNYDWGQGVPELRTWWATHGEPPISVWYYGGDTAVFLPPFRILHLHLLPDLSPHGVKTAVGPGYLAVSVGLLTACPNRKPDVLEMVAWLNSLKPVTRTPTFVVFKLE